MMCLLHPIGDGDLGGTLSAPRLLEVTGVQLSPSSGSTGSLLLASLPSSFSESFSDSAAIDSSSDSSLFPNKFNIEMLQSTSKKRTEIKV